MAQQTKKIYLKDKETKKQETIFNWDREECDAGEQNEISL